MRPVATLRVDVALDPNVRVVAFLCPHSETTASFRYASPEAAHEGEDEAVRAVARTHEERFHCGCCAPWLPPRVN